MDFIITTEFSMDRVCADLERALDESNIWYELNDYKYNCFIEGLFRFEIRIFSNDRLSIKSIIHHRVFFYAMVDELVRRLQLIRA